MAWWLALAFAQMKTTTVLVNGSPDSLQFEASGVVGQLDSMEVRREDGLGSDGLQVAFDGAPGRASLRLREDGRLGMSMARGLLLDPVVLEANAHRLFVVLATDDGALMELMLRRKQNVAPRCGSLVDELSGCVPTDCQVGEKMVRVSPTAGDGCELSVQQSKVVFNGGEHEVQRCDAADAAARAELVRVFREAGEEGVWPGADLERLCETQNQLNPAVGPHYVVWINATSDEELLAGPLREDDAESWTLEPGASRLFHFDPGTVLGTTPVSAGDADLVLDLSRGGQDDDAGSGSVRARIHQKMLAGDSTLSVVWLLDAGR